MAQVNHGRRSVSTVDPRTLPRDPFAAPRISLDWVRQRLLAELLNCSSCVWPYTVYCSSVVTVKYSTVLLCMHPRRWNQQRALAACPGWSFSPVAIFCRTQRTLPCTAWGSWCITNIILPTSSIATWHMAGGRWRKSVMGENMHLFKVWWCRV